MAQVGCETEDFRTYAEIYDPRLLQVRLEALFVLRDGLNCIPLGLTYFRHIRVFAVLARCLTLADDGETSLHYSRTRRRTRI